MLKATEYQVIYNFYMKKDGTRDCMNIKTGFKTYAEADKWSHQNTIDGRVLGVCKSEEVWE